MHSLLGHPGVERLYSTLSPHFWFPNMKHVITEFTQTCDICQRYKRTNRPHGLLPPKDITNLRAWDEVGVDFIGSWKVQVNGYKYSLQALTCTDSVINLLEIMPINDVMVQTVATAFENEWLSRYPRPLRCIHDNGSEFVGTKSQDMLKRNGISSVPTTIKKHKEILSQNDCTRLSAL